MDGGDGDRGRAGSQEHVDASSVGEVPLSRRRFASRLLLLQPVLWSVRTGRYMTGPQRLKYPLSRRGLARFPEGLDKVPRRHSCRRDGTWKDDHGRLLVSSLSSGRKESALIISSETGCTPIPRGPPPQIRQPAPKNLLQRATTRSRRRRRHLVPKLDSLAGVSFAIRRRRTPRRTAADRL